MTVLPKDYGLLRRWHNVVRRARSVAVTGATAVVQMIVIVDERGNPVTWCEPVCRRIEPRTKQDAIRSILETMGEAEREEFLEALLK